MTGIAPASRLRRKLWIAGGAIALFTLVGFFVLPPIVKSQLEKRASAALGRPVTIGRVRVNPYAGSVTLEQLDVRLKDGTGSFLGWDRLYVNADPLSSLFGAWTLGAVELDGFHVTAQLKPGGAFNFSDILEKLNPPGAPPSAAPAKPGRPLLLVSLKVNGASLDFADQSRPKPFATTLGPVTFALTEFRTTGSSGAPFHLEARSEAGEKFSWTGTLSAEPFGSKGDLRLENILLPKYLAYYADQLKGDLREGRLSVQGRYEVSLAEGARVLRLTDGAVQLRGLKLTAPGDAEPAVELPALDVTAINADALALKATVGSVALNGGHLRVRRETDGALNLLTLFEPNEPAALAASAPSPVPVATAAKLPEFMIGEVVLKDFQVDVTDRSAPRPAQLGLVGIQFSLKNVTLADGAEMPLQLVFGWAPQGTVKVEGKVAIKPEVQADLKLDVTGLGILPLSPYVEQFVNARITEGTLTASLAAQLALPAGRELAATLAGGVTIEKFGLVDGVHNEELAGFGSLALTGLRVATVPQLSLALEEVNLTAPYALVVMNEDKSLNLAGLAKSGPSPVQTAATSAPVAAAGPAPKITVGRVVIADGDYSFTDRTLAPAVRMVINHFGGTITGLSSENLAQAGVDLKATVDGAGPISITGKLDPLGARKFVDLKIDFKNVDLIGLSPYSGKFAGYELARGKLGLDVKFQLDDRKINATNVLTLNQFTFGAPVESPDATKLPVRLGVALLKDMDGKIVIDLPVQGSLDDPEFRIGKVVWRVIINLLTKAAVSPFALLGSMFGGGGDELAFQEFSPGGSALLPAETMKLDTMVKALVNRPGLSVALEGSYDGPADTYVLRQQKLAEIVRRAIWEAKHAVDPNIAPPEKLELTPEEEAGMMKQLFDEKFPPGTQFGAPLAAAPVVAALPPAAKKSFLGRVVDVVTFKNQGSDKAPPGEKSAAPATPAVADATGPSLVEMTGRLTETMGVTDDDLRALAQQRAQLVRDYFITTGKIDPERLFLAKDQPAPTDAAKAGKGPRVFLTLQ